MRSKFIRKMEGRRVAEEAETAQRLIDEEDARQEVCILFVRKCYLLCIHFIVGLYDNLYMQLVVI